MSISTTYSPQEVESKWYSFWKDKGFFRSIPDEREPYTIVMPPPNVTGVLHMGHMLNNTLQDVLIRRARMMNKNVCWVPGRPCVYCYGDESCQSSKKQRIE